MRFNFEKMPFIHVHCVNGIVAMPKVWFGDDAFWNGHNWQSQETVDYWFDGIDPNPVPVLITKNYDWCEKCYSSFCSCF